MIFSFNVEDLILIILGALATAFIISWLHRRPMKPIGIIDFILGEHEPRVKFYANVLIFIVPLVVGLSLGFFNLTPYFFGGIATALGALLSVSTAFFNPKMLAPPLQRKIGKARLVYAFFVVTYGLLGIVGTYITSEVPILLQSKSFHLGILVNVITHVFFVFCPKVFHFVLQSSFKKEFPKIQPVISENGVDKQLLKTITVEVYKAVSEATATALKVVRATGNEQDFKKLISDELSRQIKEIPQMIDLVYQQNQVRRLNRGYGEMEFNDYNWPQSYESYVDICYGDQTNYGFYFNGLVKTFESLYCIHDYLGGYDWGYGYGDNSRYLKWYYPGYFS